MAGFVVINERDAKIINEGAAVIMIIIFDIRNTQKCYAESLEIIKLIKNSSFDVAANKLDNVYFEIRHADINDKTLTDIHNNLESNCLTKLFDHPAINEIYTDHRDISFLFYVTSDSEENDIVNIQYFSLIRQEVSNCYLLLRPNCDEFEVHKAEEMSEAEIAKLKKELKSKHSELYSKAGLFLMYELRTNSGRYFCKMYEDREVSVEELKYNKNISIIKKLSPLIEISKEQDSVDYWSRPMELFIESIPTCGKMSDIESANILNYKKAEKAEQYKKARNDKDYRLLMIMRNLFCFGDCRITLKTYDSFSERNNFFNGDTFYKHIKDMPVLAFYIMCFYEYYNYVIEEKWNNDTDRLRRIIFDARDMADGLLQLIENAMNHSKNEKGCFYFRIYSIKAIGEISELKTRFNNYLSKTVDNVEYFLEARIIDYSRTRLPEKFLIKTRERKEEPNTSDKNIKKYEEVLKTFESIQMKSFFDPNEAEKEGWSQYNSIDKNVMHHYGLQLFDSLVTNSKGCFIAVSSNDYEVNDSDFYSNTEQMIGDKKIPGTQYSVLLPFRVANKDERNYAALSGKVDFSHSIGNSCKIEKGFDFSEETCKRYYNKIRNKHYPSLQERKEQLIDSMSKDFADYVGNRLEQEKSTIFYYDAKSIPIRRIEFFAKALISYLLRSRDIKINIAIFNCNENFVLETVRIFAIFYNKDGRNEYMHNAQIYLYGENGREEFIVTGKNLTSFLSFSEKIAFAQGTNPQYVKTIFQALEKRGSTNEEIEPLLLAPFALQLYPEIDQTKSPFQKAVKMVLETNIQTPSFGCNLNDTHMRIGSKIHIDSFYEAELLFHNSYYVSHFSYSLAKRIYSDKPADANNIVLVGYETYSEMLLYETADILHKLSIETAENQMNLFKKMEVEYIIYSDNKKTFCDQNLTDAFNFKNIERVENVANSLFVVIVPINSTLTTHNKVGAALGKHFKKLCKPEPKIIANYAIVLVRDSKNGKRLSGDEKRFWTDINPDHQIINTPYIEYGEKQEVFYFIDVYTKWENPLTCDACFPMDRPYSEEKPLVETDRASVVPMLKIGLTPSGSKPKDDSGCGSLMSDVGKKDQKRIELLKDYLLYRHIERKNNHFSFYFETEKLMYDREDEIIHWLRQINEKFNSKVGETNKRLSYDIVVAPIHFSNSAFVRAFESSVFSNASLVLFIDAEREFRDNIKTKYSNLQALYQNLNNEGWESEINFHFVDDTIVSGNSFMRVKSLITSIFPEEALNNKAVNINIFRSVTLLINRCSNATKTNYISDISMFNSFVDINLSSMRNHEDACVLCKYVDNSRLLSEYSATNALGDYYGRQIEKHERKIIKESVTEEDNDKKEPKYKEKTERAYRRLICSHMANCELQKVGLSANETEKVLEIMRGLLCMDRSVEYFISYIKVLSRPFFSFSKSNKEAIFFIMIKILDYLLLKQSEGKEIDRTGFEKIFDIVDNIGGYDTKYTLLITLMKRLSDMGSSFIIRKDNIKRILACHDSMMESEDLITHTTDELMRILDDLKDIAGTQPITCTIEELKKQILAKYTDIAEADLIEYVKKDLIELIQRRRRIRFENDYLSAIKRITCLSSDETKCVFLEYLLIFGEEYSEEVDGNIIKGKFSCTPTKELNAFRYKAYIENNRLIADSIKDLYHDLSEDFESIIESLKPPSSSDDCLSCGKTADKLLKTLNHQYYYENFKKTLVFMDAVNVKKGELETLDIEKFKDGYQFRLIAIIAIYHLLCHEKTLRNNVRSFYKILALLIKHVFNAGMVSIDFQDGKEPPIQLFNSENDDKNSRSKYAQLYSKEFDLDTIQITEDSNVALKYVISLPGGETKKNVFIVIEGSKLKGLHLANAVKCIAIFRKNIVFKLTSDFTNNLITDVIAERDRVERLAHFKNATHSDSTFKKDFINRYLRSSKHDARSLPDHKAAVIRFLSDSFISAKYHDAVVKSMANVEAIELAKLCSKKLEDTWVMKNFGLLPKTALFRRPEKMINDIPGDLYIKLHALYIMPRTESGDEDALSIFLPMVQNAIVHTENCASVRVSVEKVDEREYDFTIYDAVACEKTEKKRGFLYYLTIENDVAEHKNVTEESVMACLMKNILERKNEGCENEGATLYAANKYCEYILGSIEGYKIDTNLPAIDFTIKDSKVTFRLPILVEWS